MAQLTDRRFEQAKPILDRYRALVAASGRRAHFATMEAELRTLWKVGYQGLKPLMIDLSDRPGYTLLAALYMEGEAPGVASEFKARLAELYGIERYDAEDREDKRRAFWERETGQVWADE